MQRVNEKRPVHPGPATVSYAPGPPVQNFQPYPPMPMQPYSPCQPPIPYPPQPAACPPMPMNHPAYQPPPQLPGAYPRSPSRMNPHKAAHMQQWMEGPHMTSYSPCPSVAPSVVSEMSGIYSGRGSVMSYCSTNFDPMEGQCDLRSPSQTSTIENIDPMQNMIPQQTISTANLPHLIPTWKKGYSDPAYQGMVINSICKFNCDLRSLQRKNLKEEVDQMRRQMCELAHLIPEIIKVLADFNRSGVQPLTQQKYAANCQTLLRLMECLPEEALAVQIDNSKLEIILDSFLLTKNDCLLKCLDTVMDWKGPIAQKKNFRQAMRTKSLNNDFLMHLVEKLKQPTSLSNLLYNFSILTNLSGPQALNDYLVYKICIIPIIFTDVTAYLGKLFTEQPTPDRPSSNNKSQCVKIFRQILTLIRNLILKESNQKDHQSITTHMRTITVADQLAQFKGFYFIGEFFGTVFTYPMFRRKNDVIIEKVIYIFSNCSTLLVQRNQNQMTDPEVLPLLEKYCNFMRGDVALNPDPNFIIWNREIVKGIVSKVMDCMSQLLSSDIEPGNLHKHLAQALYLFINHSPFIQDQYKHPEVFSHLNQWIQKFGSFRTHPSFLKNAQHILDAEDTVIWILRVLLKPSFHPPAVSSSGLLPITALSDVVARDLLFTLFNQAVSFSKLVPQQNFIVNFELQSWTVHKELFLHLITAIGRIVKNTEAIISYPIIGEIFDEFEREHLVSWLFRFFVVVQSSYAHKKQELKEDIREGLAEIGSECLRTLMYIWIRFDPMSQAEQVVRMREKINVQMRLHLERIVCWMQDICSTKKHMNISFEFCNLICKEDPSAWTPAAKNVLMDLCQHQDSTINTSANKILASIQDPQQMAYYTDVSQAMELGF